MSEAYDAAIEVRAGLEGVEAAIRGHEIGPTLRELYAGMATQGLLTAMGGLLADGHAKPQAVAEIAVNVADALIAELDKPRKP